MTDSEAKPFKFLSGFSGREAVKGLEEDVARFLTERAQKAAELESLRAKLVAVELGLGRLGADQRQPLQERLRQIERQLTGDLPGTCPIPTEGAQKLTPRCGTVPQPEGQAESPEKRP